MKLCGVGRCTHSNQVSSCFCSEAWCPLLSGSSVAREKGDRLGVGLGPPNLLLRAWTTNRRVCMGDVKSRPF